MSMATWKPRSPSSRSSHCAHSWLYRPTKRSNFSPLFSLDAGGAACDCSEGYAQQLADFFVGETNVVLRFVAANFDGSADRMLVNVAALLEPAPTQALQTPNQAPNKQGKAPPRRR